MIRLGIGFIACFIGAFAATQSKKPSASQKKAEAKVQLGNFSVSLAVKDLAASRAFYEKLGLRVVSGAAAQRYLIMQNETSTIGIFQGMFDKNILTFNPGWDRNCKTLPEFADVRDIQRMLKEKGLTPTLEADPATSGPASMMVVDPDGNSILIDQHVPSPRK